MSLASQSNGASDSAECSATIIAKRLEDLRFQFLDNTVQGEKDPLHPHKQAVRLHEALTRLGVTNKLIVIPGGGEVLFGEDADRDAYLQIFEFLRKAGVIVRPQETHTADVSRRAP